jgi:hypothetical protein
MDVNGGTLIIDLGLERGEPPSYAVPHVRTFPTWLPAALLAALVLLLAGASAAPAQPPLTTLFSLQVGPADAYALTDEGHLLAQTFGQLTSYDLKTGRMRWQAGQSTPAYRLRMGDGLVLMRPWTVSAGDPGTTAVSLATGASEWRRDGNVVTLAGSSTLLDVQPVRSLGGPGRRVEDSVDAVDPLTGQTRWTVRVPSTAVLIGVPGIADEAPRMLLMHDDRTLAVHDLDTGRLLASTKVPAADYDPENPAVAGGVIILRFPVDQGEVMAAYDPDTLDQLWTAPAARIDEIVPCGMLACVSGPDGVRGVDPVTGTVRWTRPAWRQIAQQGTAYIAYAGADSSDPLGVVDPDTGAMRVRLDGWRPVSGTGEDGRLLLTRTSDDGGRTMVAVARPGDPRPRLLTELPTGTGDCQAAPARLVCRSMYGELVVWAYQER